MNVVSARVNHGRWVGDCSACNSAFLLTLGQTDADCRDCGTPFAVVWPPEADLVEAALSRRPSELNRNFDPSFEDVASLLRENAEHGVA